VSIFKRGSIYWYKFMWNGELIRESTKQRNDRKARQSEAAHRTRLAKQQDAREEARRRMNCSQVLLCEECEKWFNAEDAQRQDERTFCSGSCSAQWTKRHTRVPTLEQFFEHDFKPYVEAHFSAKPKTGEYYAYGTALLLEVGMGALPLNEISSQHAAGYIAKQRKRSPSTINCGLRTLRRALNLAEEWGKIDRAPKFALAKGERQRERVVTQAEFLAYLELCRQPWRDVATVLYGTGNAARRSLQAPVGACSLERYRGGLIQIAEGKTKAARQIPADGAGSVLRHSQHATTGQKATSNGVGLSGRAPCSGHLEESSAKIYHGEAVKKLTTASAAYAAWAEQGRKCGDWIDAVKAGTKLDPDYLERHGGADTGRLEGL
jgi:hypothetical protein